MQKKRMTITHISIQTRLLLILFIGGAWGHADSHHIYGLYEVFHSVTVEWEERHDVRRRRKPEHMMGA